MPEQRKDYPVYYYERGPCDSDDILRVSCWCEERAVRIRRELVGERTYSCGTRKCERMNAEYESRGKA